MAGTTDPSRCHRATAHGPGPCRPAPASPTVAPPGTPAGSTDPLGRQLAVLAFQAGLTPNQVTVRVRAHHAQPASWCSRLAPPTVRWASWSPCSWPWGTRSTPPTASWRACAGAAAAPGSGSTTSSTASRSRRSTSAVLISWYASLRRSPDVAAARAAGLRAPLSTVLLRQDPQRHAAARPGRRPPAAPASPRAR